LIELAVGAYLANAAVRRAGEVFYWREQNREVDFIIRAGRTILALEVKSGRSLDAFPGRVECSKAFKPARAPLVGGDGLALDEVLTQPVEHWLA
jgi:predicted AAA+ superfamily ATPase